MHGARALLRKLVPGVMAIVVLAGLRIVASSQEAVAGAPQIAAQYRFTELPIAMPPGYDKLPMKTIRQVNPAYQHISAWISSIGASIAINDLTGHGRSDSMCIV